MGEQKSFLELMVHVRAGDQRAAAELVRRYEPAIRRFIRGRLTDGRLQRTLDSMDVCQSVMRGFFTRVALGQFELESPDQLVKLLAKMANNKLIEVARREHAVKRGAGRQPSVPVDEIPVDGQSPTASRIVSGRELLDQFRKTLSREELYLFDQRNEERPWNELASELGTSADALRMRWKRVVDRAAVDLGWDAAEDE